MSLQENSNRPRFICSRKLLTAVAAASPEAEPLPRTPCSFQKWNRSLVTAEGAEHTQNRLRDAAQGHAPGRREFRLTDVTLHVLDHRKAAGKDCVLASTRRTTA